MSCSTSTPSVMRPGSVSSSRFSYSTLTMITVLDSAQAMQRYSASKWPPPIDRPIPMKNNIPSRQPPINCPPAANRMTLPARTIFFRSISSPIMNSMKIRPSSEMTLIEFLGLDPAHAEWTNDEPGDKVGQDQRLPGKMRQQAEHPGEQDT